eukprot:3017687-Heterocapsa_arctica.AAC.1
MLYYVTLCLRVLFVAALGDAPKDAGGIGDVGDRDLVQPVVVHANGGGGAWGPCVAAPTAKQLLYCTILYYTML